MGSSIADMLSAYERLVAIHHKKSEGMTAKEIMRMMGWARQRTDRFINESIAAGLMRCEKAPRPQRDGVIKAVPVYVRIKRRSRPS